ncbi:MAG TPA: hypothetical protein VMQ56_04890 [Terracidiphilus sp.]|jgi:hypothetical protein|nr:hypothetical protein [Terracidiphilus sp.]
MDKIVAQGRIIFAIAVAAFGIENLICAHSTHKFLPVIPWIPSYPWLAYLTGVAFLAAAVCIAARFHLRWTAVLLGVVFLACDLLLQLPQVLAAPLDVGIRTTAFETLTMCSASLMLAASVPAKFTNLKRWDGVLNKFLASGRYFFAISAIVFGIDHYIVFGLIVSLVPRWIPGGGWFWANVTALAFVAAGVSIAFRWMDRLAATLLGVMFLLWFLVLHLPRVVSYPRSHDPDEWSSAFIALAVCGASWILAASLDENSGREKLQKVK